MKILSKEFKITYVNDSPLDLTSIGRAYISKQEIYLCKDLPNDKIEETMLHEVLHCIDDIFKSELTEKQVELISNGLFIFLKENNVDTSFLTPNLESK